MDAGWMGGWINGNYKMDKREKVCITVLCLFVSSLGWEGIGRISQLERKEKRDGIGVSTRDLPSTRFIQNKHTKTFDLVEDHSFLK